MKTETVPIEQRYVSYYAKGKTDTKGIPITLYDFFEGVRTNPEWKKVADYAREAVDDKPEYDIRKNLAPVIIPYGTAEGNKSGAALQTPAGVMAIDLDHLGDKVAGIKVMLRENPYVLAVFYSMSGRGLCIFFRVDVERWLDAFNGIQQYILENYGLVGKQFDTSSKNKNRLRFISHDPDIFINWEAKVFTKYIRKAAKKKQEKVTYINSDRDLTYVLDQIQDGQIDIAPGYEDWYRMAWSLISQYNEGARDLFKLVSRYNESYDPEEADAKFNYLVDVKPHSLTISTFYWLCKEAKIDIISPLSKKIGSIADMSKRNGVTLESAIDSVVKMTEATVEEAREVVEQIYKSKETFDTGDSIYDQMELFLRQNYELRYNEVRRVFEYPGKINPDTYKEESIEDSHLFSMHIAASKILGDDLKYQSFDRLVHSHNVFPKVNPVKQFFQTYKHYTETGFIERLAETIDTDTGLTSGNFSPGFKLKYITKWLIGLISGIFGEPSPLVLVLTGAVNKGKTRWFRGLLPDELRGYFYQSTWQDNKDEQRRMCTNIISFNDEFDMKDQTEFKHFRALTSTDLFTLREVYTRKDITLKRIAAMGGSSNPLDIINDPEFNRRIVPINVLSINFKAYNEIDKVALLMEAYYAYQANKRGFDVNAEDIEELKTLTEDFQRKGLERQLVEQYLSKPEPTTPANQISYYSATDILFKLEAKAGGRRLELNKIGSALSALGFEKVNKRDSGKSVKPYKLVFHE